MFIVDTMCEFLAKANFMDFINGVVFKEFKEFV